MIESLPLYVLRASGALATILTGIAILRQLYWRMEYSDYIAKAALSFILLFAITSIAYLVV